MTITVPQPPLVSAQVLSPSNPIPRYKSGGSLSIRTIPSTTTSPSSKISSQVNQSSPLPPPGTFLWAIANTPAPPPVQRCARARCGRRVDYYRQCFICQRQIYIQCSYQLPGVVSIGGYGLDSVCPPCVHWWNTRATQERKLQVLQTASVIHNVHRELGL